MKKVFVIALAIVMALGCVSAFAYQGSMIGTFGEDLTCVGQSFNDDTPPTGCVRNDGTNSRGLPNEDAIFINRGTDAEPNICVRVTGSTYLCGDNLAAIAEASTTEINLCAQALIKFVQDAQFCGIVMDNTDFTWGSTNTTTPIRADGKYILTSGYGFSLRAGNIIDVFINASATGSVDNAEISLSDFGIDASEFNTYAIYRSLEEKAYIAVNNILVSVIDLSTGFIYDATETTVLAEGNDDKYNTAGGPFLCVVGDDATEVYFDNVSQDEIDAIPEFTIISEDETTLDTAQVDVFSKKVTVNVRLDLAASATNDDYTVVINGTEATLVNGTFISAPIDLNNIADEFDIELYDGEDLIDSVEGYSVKAYLESLDNKVCADVLALGSALDVYTGGEGFAVEGASAALEVAPTAPAKTAARDSADDYIKGATLLIDEDINIAFTLKTTNATSVVISADDFDDKIVDDIADKYVLTADIALADLATVFRADLMVEDTGVAYATYSALNYICKNYNNADAKLAAVCQALYAVYADLNVPEV